ncbi:MAG: hypothetical protein AABX95_03020 [Nanoarchaeota archaeon]
MTNVPFRDEKDYEINREIVFDDKTNTSFSLVDKERKKVVHIFTELNRNSGRHAFEVYDLSNCVPRNIYSSEFDYCSVNSARDAGRKYLETLPVLSVEPSSDNSN